MDSLFFARWDEDFKYIHSPWMPIHISDAVRLAFLWKYGGLYLDLDSLVLKPFLDNEENFIGIQYYSVDDGINTAVMKFEKHHPFLSQWMYAVPTKYEEEDRATIGPHLATRLIVPYCQGDPPESKRNLEEISGKYCDYKVKILPPKAFYPVPWPDWKKIFVRDDEDSMLRTLLQDPETYVLHYWNELSEKLTDSEMSKDSPFMKLAESNCPLIYYHEFERKMKRAKLLNVQQKFKTIEGGVQIGENEGA